MKYAGILLVFCCFLLPARGEEAARPIEEINAETVLPEEPRSELEIGGGIWGRYLRLDLRHWTFASGARMDREDLFYYGGRVVISGPLREDGDIRWRFGGTLGGAGNWSDEVDELNLGLFTAGLTSGLSWRPGKIGVSLDLSLGGAAIDTEIKRAELDADWELYERRTVGLFYWEPLLSLDFEVMNFFVIRLQGGYTFLYGRGKEVGGPTAGLAFDFGNWM